MKNILLALAATLAFSCRSIFRNEAGDVDLGKVADQVELARQTVLDFAPMASPATQEKLVELLGVAGDPKQRGKIGDVIDALDNAALGGPISDLRSTAGAALGLTDSILAQINPQSDLRFAVNAIRAALRYLAVGETAAASAELESPRSVNNSPVVE